MKYNTEKYVWRRQIEKERLDERIQKKSTQQCADENKRKRSVKKCWSRCGNQFLRKMN